MDNVIENTAIRNINVDLPEALYSELKDYANNQGVKPDDALLSLLKVAMQSHNLNNGVVSDFTPELFKKLAGVVAETMENTPIKVEVEHPSPQAEASVLSNDNSIVFVASEDMKILIARINAHRVTKGLAPIENSLCELVLHWGISLGDNSIFKAVNGEDLSLFKDVVTQMAYAEREQNNVPSDVIKSKGGIFSSYTIVDTPKKL